MLSLVAGWTMARSQWARHGFMSVAKEGLANEAGVPSETRQ